MKSGLFTFDPQPGVVPPGSITNNELADMPALSVKVNATNTAAEPQDLQASASGQVLTRSGSSLVWASPSTTPTLQPESIFLFAGDSKLANPTAAPATPIETFFVATPTGASLQVENVASDGYELNEIITNYSTTVYPYAPGQSLNPTGKPAVLCVWVGAGDLPTLNPGNAATYLSDLLGYYQQAVDDGFRVMAWIIEKRGDYDTATIEEARAEVNYGIRHSQIPTWIVDPEIVMPNVLDVGWWDIDEIHHTSNGNYRLNLLMLETLSGGSTPLDFIASWGGPDAARGALIAAGTAVRNSFSVGQTIVGGSGLTTTGACLNLQSDDSGVVGPHVIFNHNSASPLAGDILGGFFAYGNDSGGNSTPYGGFGVNIVDPTDTSEDASITFGTMVAGTFVSDRITVRQGLIVRGATGGDQGVGTFNATALYANGNLVADSNGLLRGPGFTVGTLPAASGVTGARTRVSDSNAAITAGIGAVVAGGGAAVVPVFSDGTNWRIA